ncbi:MAG: PP0621 family protein [Arcobacter sp.]|uniref:Prokaryotic metallothionein n=1 Tax=Arcobacter defluvii TaxID=873191 RepID=A0AAE7BEJ4_9BACT|nr:PP0621 family protein [Arcobacter defluvii]QKF77638.1 hypothetical protein ADFLV_1618 [Arcobacter defluvii]RXI34388.1 hypothetical protein CP964_03260 [Arcobacter defluvii]
MVLKVILVIAVAFLVYVFLFKKTREKEINKKDEMITDDMVECPTCKTYVSKKEAIVSNGKFYCSNECLLNK